MYGFAVVGIKGVGGTHIDAVRALPNARLVAVVDVDEAAAKEAAAKHDCRAFTDHEAMLALPEIDVVNIATPHPFHPPIAIAALQAGKHVIVEKPMAVTTREADTMVAAARAAGRWLGVNYQARTSIRNQTIRHLVRDELGDLYRISSFSGGVRTQAYYNSAAWRGTWKGEGGGVLLNQAPHDLDLFLWFCGIPRQVRAWTTTQIHNIEVEDMADAILSYDNGAVGHLHANTLDVPSCERLEFFGRRAALVADAAGLRRSRLAQPLDEFIRTSPEMWGRLESSWEPVALPEQTGPRGHTGIAADMIAAIEANRPPIAPGEEGVASVELANAMILSSKRGKTVDLPLDRDEYDELLAELRRDGATGRRGDGATG
jgi:UDP-N-acetyl-2-amino-2-deoxyglucuronate dehydrogenase